MEWLHPITLEQEITVDVKVAALVVGDLGTERLLDVLAVEVLTDPSELGVAEIAGVLALATNIINILSGLLVWADHSVVAVDGSWDTAPDGLRLVAALNEGQAAWQSVVHSLAFAGVEDSWPSSVTAGHWLVVFVLCKTIGKTVSDQDGLEVDVTLLVGKNLAGEDWDIVTGV